jgi:hypothetical protein
MKGSKGILTQSLWDEVTVRLQISLFNHLSLVFDILFLVGALSST